MFQSFFEGFRRIAPANNDPNRVIEVPVEEYVCYTPVCRDECLVLYKTDENETRKFDIVLQIEVSQSATKAYR